MPPQRSLSDILDRLERQRTVAVYSTAFLDDLVSKEGRWEKYRNSLAGNVIALQIVAVQSALNMWCSRVWDVGRDFDSVPSAFAWMNAPSYVADNPDLLDVVRAQYEVLSKSRVGAVARVIRSESLAHLVEVSRDRKNLGSVPFDSHGVTLNDLLDFSKESIRLIDRMVLVERHRAQSYDRSADAFQASIDAYWNNLPVFEEAERKGSREKPTTH